MITGLGAIRLYRSFARTSGRPGNPPVFGTPAPGAGALAPQRRYGTIGTSRRTGRPHVRVNVNPVERDWVDAMLHHIGRKITALLKPEFTEHPTNWLLVYGNW